MAIIWKLLDFNNSALSQTTVIERGKRDTLLKRRAPNCLVHKPWSCVSLKETTQHYEGINTSGNWQSTPLELEICGQFQAITKLVPISTKKYIPSSFLRQGNWVTISFSNSQHNPQSLQRLEVYKGHTYLLDTCTRMGFCPPSISNYEL